ncbi:cysteate racemase [Pseudothauera rhizosphaerae]|uniref:Aspartate/glutamate racemase family protein n=1 Tax=Pseudothauera rhizosphaerae TaxID=2565932 RepID=A0A4V3WBZ9_9RHOO|nr:amino acid racemase [Pseudothauera rhizosphaerae]THF65182.1 aspartate/glutamate racemase family protein [Pseudothauera rhizosphaerae]
MSAAFAGLGPFVGVLGGMGPLATVDLLAKIIEETPATFDQDHVPVVAHNVAQIPDRQRFVAGTGPSPLPAMLAGIARLDAIGAGCIAIPCNTAHIWFDELAAGSRAPLIHIADAAAEDLHDGAPVTRVGLLATQGTLRAAFYQNRFAARGILALTNSDEEFDTLFTPGCYAVKAGDLPRAARLLGEAAAHLAERGAERLVLACTEVPPALARLDATTLPPQVDATRALARACVRWWQEHHHPA